MMLTRKENATMAKLQPQKIAMLQHCVELVPKVPRQLHRATSGDLGLLLLAYDEEAVPIALLQVTSQFTIHHSDTAWALQA